MADETNTVAENAVGPAVEKEVSDLERIAQELEAQNAENHGNEAKQLAKLNKDELIRRLILAETPVGNVELVSVVDMKDAAAEATGAAAQPLVRVIYTDLSSDKPEPLEVQVNGRDYVLPANEPTVVPRHVGLHLVSVGRIAPFDEESKAYFPKVSRAIRIAQEQGMFADNRTS